MAGLHMRPQEQPHPSGAPGANNRQRTKWEGTHPPLSGTQGAVRATLYFSLSSSCEAATVPKRHLVTAVTAAAGKRAGSTHPDAVWTSANKR